MKTIAIIIPTIRPERVQWMQKKWGALWEKHNARVFWVNDGPVPTVDFEGQVMGVPPWHSHLFFNLNDGIRNLGFYWAKHLVDPDVYITLDDDVRPMDNDPIQEHLDILGERVSTSWFSSTLYPHYMRGFPYGVRVESTVEVSHGVWHGVPDLDAVTQLVSPNLKPEFYRGIVPSGAKFPLCGMNLAWTREVAGDVYFAPMGPKTPYSRFADIWMGNVLKGRMDGEGQALATGFSRVWHERASDVWKNLEAERGGMKVNEDLAAGVDLGYMDLWTDNIEGWKKIMR